MDQIETEPQKLCHVLLVSFFVEVLSPVLVCAVLCQGLG